MAIELGTFADVASINVALDGDYLLVADLDSSSTGYSTYAAITANSGLGWETIGNYDFGFTGTFDGGGHTISDVFINRDVRYCGFFGYGWKCSISNLKLGITISGITGAREAIGGLVGALSAYTATASVSNCSVVGSITTTGSVSSAGLLIGQVRWDSSVSKCGVSGSITCAAGSQIGGFVGKIERGSEVLNSRASVDLLGSIAADGGGFAGLIQDVGSTLGKCYSTGIVTGSDATIGGLVGRSTVSIGASFWDTETSGQASSAGGTGKTTAQMQTESTFTGAGWDFTTVWQIDEGVSYPELQWEVVPTELIILLNYHDGTDGVKLEYNVTDSAYRLTHGVEYGEFAHVRAGTEVEQWSYDPATKTAKFYIDGSQIGADKVFTSALSMPATGDFTIEGNRTVDEILLFKSTFSDADIEDAYLAYTDNF